MHKIEAHILYHLVHHTKARYRDIKPEDVEGNHFMYYLKKLLEAGVITKSDSWYHLSPAGKRYADSLSLKTLQPRIQPKIVTLVICTNSKGEVLLYKRSREPFIDLVGFPYGKIHLGETVQKSAERELKEKTGIRATLKHAGDAYIAVYDKKDLISHMLAHVLVGKNPTGKLSAETTMGSCFWGDLTDYPKKEILPANTEIYKMAKQSGHFFHEFVIKL